MPEIADKHTDEIAKIIDDHRARLNSDMSTSEKAVVLRACSAAIAAACDRHRVELNAPPPDAHDAPTDVHDAPVAEQEHNR